MRVRLLTSLLWRDLLLLYSPLAFYYRQLVRSILYLFLLLLKFGQGEFLCV
jgi:hypothetical protein